VPTAARIRDVAVAIISGENAREVEIVSPHRDREGMMDRHDWDRRYAESRLVWSLGPNRFLAAEVGELAPGNALDLACGEGRNALWLAKRGWRVTGVDFSEVAIAKARRRTEEEGLEVDWIVSDLLDYEPAAAAFDLVLLFYLQVPPDERRRIVHTAAATTAPGGTFLLVGHDRRNVEHGHGGPTDATVLYTPEEIVADLAGFDLEKAELVERPVETDDGERIALDALVRARRPLESPSPGA
jgi:SAM-dependent methyltransferase